MQRLIGGRIYYGWVLVPIACACYGLGIAPAYGSWGFFAPELSAELGLSRQDIGSVFGSFSLCLLAASPITGAFIHWFGLRFTISFGALVAAAGMWSLSQAQSLADCYLSYSLLAGVGLALSTAFPMQTLATFWFKKYRARASAIILAGGTGVGTVIAPINELLLQYGGWRFGWQVYAGVSLLVAVVATIFIRDSPEMCGLAIDGIVEPETDSVALSTLAAAPKQRVRDTIVTPQFFLISLCAFGQLGPWTVFTAHSRMHLEALLIGSAVAAGVLSTKNVASTIGRLSAAGGDFVSPRVLLAAALVIEALGFAGLAVAQQRALVFVSTTLFGLGFGAAMLCVSLTFAEIFGRQAFVTTSGASRALQGVFNFAAPTVVGMLADRLGSYTVPFLGLSGLALIAALGIAFCHPVVGKTAPRLDAMK
ncbi:MAG TPA: MFS transporter [Pirellulales bacterium]|nr:MFS transporter [Pirellulales bacterium]